MQLIIDNGLLNKAIASIKERGARLDGDIHVAACSVMAHLAVHRDTTLVKRLNAAMPKSSRRKALIDWFEKFMPVKVNYTTCAVTMPKADSPEWAEFVEDFEATIETAIATPFWDLKPEKGEKDKLSYDQVLAYLIRKANAKDADDELQAKLNKVVAFAESLKEESNDELPLGDAEPAPRLAAVR